MTGPYSTAADAYWRAGWRGIVPLPAKAKKNPPAGFTGAGGVYPSYADLDAWANGPERVGNIALRMPSNVIGIDVDAYGDKPGEETLRLAEAQHGQLPPTWRTTSRDDGISGIRLYRVPEGLAWPGEIGPATELIQARHRYAIVWPSIHPEGKTYRWIGPDGVVSTTVPDPDDLPPLPDAWVDAYTGNELASDVARVKVEHAEALTWLVGRDHSTAAMCDRMQRVADQMTQDLRGSAHNAGRDGALRVARLADEGHHGAVHALTSLKRDFITEATNADRALLGKARRTKSEAEYEWSELVASAVGMVVANPTGVKTCDCFGQLTEIITGGSFTGGSFDFRPVVEDWSKVDGATALDPAERTVEAPVATETTPDAEPDGLKRMRDGASFILDAPESVPSIWGEGDSCLWAEGEALMIVGPPGVGKTTVCGQVVRGLLGLEDRVLDLPVEPTDGNVLYLAMDRPKQIARSLRRIFDETERAILADRVRVWEGPPPGDVARHPGVLLSLAELAGASVVIVDSLKDAAVGLTEDEVAAAYNRARQTCLANNVEVLELHHMVKRGAAGNKPTELADVYGSAWLTAGAGSVVLVWGAAGDPIVELRHLKQPAEEVGPYRLQHVGGRTTIWHETDLVMTLAAAGRSGVIAKAAACAIFETEKPSHSEIEKARRRLDRLVDQGLATRFEEADPLRGGKPTSVYRSNHGAITDDYPAGAITEQSRQSRETAKPQVRAITEQSRPIPQEEQSRSLPLLEGGECAPGPSIDLETVDCNRCGRAAPLAVITAFKGICGQCAVGR